MSSLIQPATAPLAKSTTPMLFSPSQDISPITTAEHPSTSDRLFQPTAFGRTTKPTTLRRTTQPTTPGRTTQPPAQLTTTRRTTQRISQSITTNSSSTSQPTTVRRTTEPSPDAPPASTKVRVKYEENGEIFEQEDTYNNVTGEASISVPAHGNNSAVEVIMQESTVSN